MLFRGPLATAPVTVAAGPVKLPWVVESVTLMSGCAGSDMPGITEAGVLANEAIDETRSVSSDGCSSYEYGFATNAVSMGREGVVVIVDMELVLPPPPVVVGMAPPPPPAVVVGPLNEADEEVGLTELAAEDAGEAMELRAEDAALDMTTVEVACRP